MPSQGAPRGILRLRSARSGDQRTWHERHRASLGPGDRAADVLRNAMGSWRFVGGFVAVMAVWIVLNSSLLRWDRFPYILLNLFLSMLAGLQGAILLIAAKRQDAVAAALAANDFETNRAAKADIETLLAINQQQLQLIDALQRRLAGEDGARSGAPSVVSDR